MIHSLNLLQNFTESPAFRYAKGVHHGDYTDRPIFTELVDAMVQLHEREANGKGLQNFHYGAALNRFTEESFIISPKLYKRMRKILPLRTERSSQYEHNNSYLEKRTDLTISYRSKRSQKPKFPPRIAAGPFKLLRAYLTMLCYYGPVGLACDDTKIRAGLRPYWDPELKQHVVVGGSAGPIVVTDVPQFEEVLRGEGIEKATKVWM
jgi:hypothetical protein